MQILQKFIILNCSILHIRSFYFPNIYYVRKYWIVKKFNFEILMYFCFLRSLEFIYAIFGMMYACMCVCVCMWVNTISSKWCIQFTSNLVRILQVTVGRTLLILVNIGWIVFLQEYKKEFLYITAYGAKFFKVF